MISTHVLDTALGVPAAGVEVTLDLRQGAVWTTIGHATTDANGRIASFSAAPLGAGTYRLTFATAAYHRRHGLTPFFPEVVVTFDVQTSGHYHVPLLLSPYGFSTYRGT
jgi:5-hydroxyisourate hydrolase